MKELEIFIYIISIIIPFLGAINVFKNNDETYVAGRFLEFMLILCLALIPFVNTFMSFILIKSYYEKKTGRKI
jgi:Na+/phosphate symporter